jgi:hypothetical protein
LAPSVAVFAQYAFAPLPHGERPPPHVVPQAPPEHTCPAPHALPQAPQLALSVFGFTQ